MRDIAGRGRERTKPRSLRTTATTRMVPLTFSLAGIDAKQDEILSLLHNPDTPHIDMLTTLMVSNSLLELSKLASSRVSLAEFANAAVLTMSHCAPMNACAISFASPGLPAVFSTFGVWPSTDDLNELVLARTGSAQAIHTCPLFAKDPNEPMGYVGITGAPCQLISAGLLTQIAGFLSSILALLIESEYMRRAASASHAMELAGALAETYEEQQLFDIVATIATLPGAVGAALLLELPRFGGPVCVEAGTTKPDVTPTIHRESFDRNSSGTLRVWWSEEGTPPPDSRLEEIVGRFFLSLNNAERSLRLHSEVETDELTGIGNRRRAIKALGRANARARRNSEGYAVLFLDLDAFKSINDEFGHDIGDEVLRAFAGALERAVRIYDVAARWGGEEFLIICPSTDLLGAEAVAKRLLDDTPVSCAAVLPEGRLQTVSIGIVVCQDPMGDPMQVVRSADAAMYLAKAAGRNCYVSGSLAKPKYSG